MNTTEEQIEEQTDGIEPARLWPGVKIDPDTGRRVSWNGKPITRARAEKEKTMATPGEGEDTDTIAGALFHISRLSGSRDERSVELARLVLAHPYVAPLRYYGICQQHSIKMPGGHPNLERDAPFLWALFHALKYRPAPEQSQAMFMEALGAVARFRNPAKRHEHVAKVRLMFDPLVSGEGADRAIEAVKLHPLLDNRDQREAHELLKLAAVVLPLVREAAKTMPSGRPGAIRSGRPMVSRAVPGPDGKMALKPVSGPGIGPNRGAVVISRALSRSLEGSVPPASGSLIPPSELPTSRVPRGGRQREGYLVGYPSARRWKRRLSPDRSERESLCRLDRRRIRGPLAGASERCSGRQRQSLEAVSGDAQIRAGCLHPRCAGRL